MTHSYTVRYDKNGGSGEQISDQSFKYDVEQALSANTYTRTGYTFLGWNKEKTAATAEYSDKALVKNLTAGDETTAQTKNGITTSQTLREST